MTKDEIIKKLLQYSIGDIDLSQMVEYIDLYSISFARAKIEDDVDGIIQKRQMKYVVDWLAKQGVELNQAPT